MGLFASLFGNPEPSNVELVPDQIWLTQGAKLDGLQRLLVQPGTQAADAILIAAHFDDVLGELIRIEEAYQGETPVKAVPAANLNESLALNLNQDASARIEILVAERHPLPSVEQQLVTFANELPCRVRLSHHLSLEDAVMTFLLGDIVSRFVSRLAMDETEAITSPMVTRRFQAAQKKIAKAARGNQHAHSAAEWLRLNRPENPTH